ncbi:MAG: hypothetical protein AB1439_02005 [candidate division FCPU426 bacterium]
MIRRVTLSIIAFFCLAVYPAFQLLAAEDQKSDQLAGAPEKKTEEKTDSSQEVVIKGVQRLKVKVVKPEPDISFDVDEIAVPYVVTEDSVLDISPTSMTDPQISVPSTLNSAQAASPFIQLFKRPPILTLNPRYNSQVNISKWSLRITDGFGNVFKNFTGEGSLPKQIIWDGTDKNKQMLDIGTSYSYIFSIVDVASNPTSQMGKPVILESLLYEENGELIAQVTSEVMFEKGERKTTISQKGQLYLREVADLITSRQNFPVQLEAYAKDLDDASAKGEIIQDYLVERLTIPKENIKLTPRKSRIAKILFKIK